jgi:hypothetical protein
LSPLRQLIYDKKAVAIKKNVRKKKKKEKEITISMFMMRLRNANFTLDSIKNPGNNDGEAMTHQELSLSPLRCFTN